VIKPDDLIPYLGDYLTASESKEFRFCCPFCPKIVGKPDNDYHLYLNPSKRIGNTIGWYFCQRCNSKGTAARLGKLLGILSNEVAVDDSIFDHWMNVLMFPSRSLTTTVEVKITIPEHLSGIVEGSLAEKYLLDRNIGYDLIKKYGIMDIPYSCRLFLPIVKDGIVVYWTARTYYPGGFPKYVNCEAPRRIHWYGIEHLDPNKPVVIVEGPISAVVGGNNSIAGFGKYISDEQLSILFSIHNGPYIVALDHDAYEEAEKLCDRISHRRPGSEVRIVRFFDDNDPADLGPGLFGRNVSESIEFSTTNKLKMKLGVI